MRRGMVAVAEGALLPVGTGFALGAVVDVLLDHHFGRALPVAQPELYLRDMSVNALRASRGAGLAAATFSPEFAGRWAVISPGGKSARTDRHCVACARSRRRRSMPPPRRDRPNHAPPLPVHLGELEHHEITAPLFSSESGGGSANFSVWPSSASSALMTCGTSSFNSVA